VRLPDEMYNYALLHNHDTHCSRIQVYLYDLDESGRGFRQRPRQCRPTAVVWLKSKNPPVRLGRPPSKTNLSVTLVSSTIVPADSATASAGYSLPGASRICEGEASQSLSSTTTNIKTTVGKSKKLKSVELSDVLQSVDSNTLRLMRAAALSLRGSSSITNREHVSVPQPKKMTFMKRKIFGSRKDKKLMDVSKRKRMVSHSDD